MSRNPHVAEPEGQESADRKSFDSPYFSRINTFQRKKNIISIYLPYIPDPQMFPAGSIYSLAKNRPNPSAGPGHIGNLVVSK